MMLVVATAILSAVLCALYVRVARHRNILDHPNTRSAHNESTPHGGGLPLYLAFAIAVMVAVMNGALFHWHYLLVLAVASILVATGIVDDLRNLPIKLRLSSYALLSLGTTVFLLQGHVQLVSLTGIVLTGLIALSLLWLLNLYNFMDGIDGIAALQAAGACFMAALLSQGDEYGLFCLLLAAAQVGFLMLNRPRAELFMGDAGSIPTGFVMGALAVIGAIQGVLDPLVWLVLLAVFITDATWTLLWRIFTGQSFLQAHNLHAYQRLSRHWGSHLRVDALFLFVFFLWLAPIAWMITSYPSIALFLVLLAYLPLLCGMAKASTLK